MPGHILIAMIPPLQTYFLVPDMGELLGVGSLQGISNTCGDVEVQKGGLTNKASTAGLHGAYT